MIGYRNKEGETPTVATIYLGDYHLEYGSCLGQALPEEMRAGSNKVGAQGQDWYSGEVIWDDYDLQDAASALRPLEEDAAERLIRVLKDQIFPQHFAEVPHIWKLYGTLDALIWAFNTLADALDTIPSGDDDVFDYWPNTMDMLYEFAGDLDTLGAGKDGDDFARTVYQIYEKVKKHFEDEGMEWIKQNGFDIEVWSPGRRG